MTKEAAPEPTVLLRGKQVWLRPVEAADVSLLHCWHNDPAVAGPFQSPLLASLAQLERRHVDRPAIGDDGGALLIVRPDGEGVGMVTYHRVLYGAYSPAFNLGITVAVEHRGHGYGSEAQQLLADFLLFTFPVGRVEASTDVENVAEQRALEGAGFQREGHRAQRLVAGGPVARHGGLQSGTERPARALAGAMRREGAAM